MNSGQVVRSSIFWVWVAAIIFVYGLMSGQFQVFPLIIASLITAISFARFP